MRELLAAYPEAAREKGGHGKLPLHYAAATGHEASRAVVRELCKAHPEAAWEMGMEEDWASEDGASEDGASEDGSEDGSDGRFRYRPWRPIHSSEDNAGDESDSEDGYRPRRFGEASVEVVRDLLLAHPEGAKEKD